VRNFLFAVGLVISIVPPFLPATAQTIHPVGGFPNDVNCDRRWTVRETAACTGEQADLWDKSLNAEYKNALQRVTDDSRPHLVKAQRLWVQFRDANCAVQFAQGGTVAQYYGQKCVLDTTRNRAKELRMIAVQ